MKSTTTRNPKGVSKTKPIALRLLPDERADATKISKEIHKSESAMARDAYLLGLPILKEQLTAKIASELGHD